MQHRQEPVGVTYKANPMLKLLQIIQTVPHSDKSIEFSVAGARQVKVVLSDLHNSVCQIPCSPDNSSALFAVDVPPAPQYHFRKQYVTHRHTAVLGKYCYRVSSAPSGEGVGAEHRRCAGAGLFE